MTFNSMAEKIEAAEKLSKEVGEICNEAMSKANQLLEPYGYKLQLVANFHELEKNKELHDLEQES